MAESRKHLLGSPTGVTPVRPTKRAPGRPRKLRSKKKLDFSKKSTSSQVIIQEWSKEEDRALVQFVLLTGTGNAWPGTKSIQYWEKAAKFVHQQCESKPLRTSGGCRCRVTIVLKKRYNDPLQAEEQLVEFTATKEAEGVADQKSSMESTGSPEEGKSSMESTGSLSEEGVSSSEALHLSPVPVIVIDAMQELMTTFDRLPSEQQLTFLSETFSIFAESHSDLTIPSNYLHLSLEGMKRLKESKRVNVLYELAKGLGIVRPDGSDSVFPTRRMPMGLLQYMVLFFNAGAGQHVLCSEDYRSWLQTMFVLFGSKWIKLFCGPLWSNEPTQQGSGSVDICRDPIKARVNVPGLGERTIQRNIAGSNFSTGSEVQIATLDEASLQHRKESWWIKADGCDLVSSLEESVRLEWNGDVDFGDGKLQQLFKSYHQRLCGLEDLSKLRSNPQLVLMALKLEGNFIINDLKLLTDALKDANDEYASKVESGSTEKILYSLGWKVDELTRLLQAGRKLLVEITALQEILVDKDTDLVSGNIPLRLTKAKAELTPFIKRLYKYKRTAATHIFVVMISTQSRSKKPYALPVQCIPYVSMTHEHVRQILNNLISLMNERKMKISGFVSNGEYNSMRVKGYTRPLSVLRIRSDARRKYSSLGVKSMIEMLTPIRQKDGDVVPLRPNAAISKDLLLEIQQWQTKGASEDDVISRLRTRTVPPGYLIHPWKKDGSVKDEDKADKLRSILAQLEYKHQVTTWNNKGVPFCTHMYVPETHPITNTVFQEREDFAHVFKRIAPSTRCGGPLSLRLDRFTDESSGLTFTALTGKRKQSVRDVEILFSESMQKFMEKMKYDYEARYIKVIRNWRRACDERGLSQLARCKFNYELLNFILDELMPWHKDIYDFSLMEVNRSVDGVCGFSRETTIALTTNIESCEWKRRELAKQGEKGENPRASTTDDVECFFSIMRDLTGKHFTLRQAKYTWRKASMEFSKRLDPALGFFYHTSSHDRFYEGERPHFDQPGVSKSAHNPRHQRVRKREQPANLAVGRATFPTPGARSTRTQFHNLPVELPPPPLPKGAHPDVQSEHSYFKK